MTILSKLSQYARNKYFIGASILTLAFAFGKAEAGTLEGTIRDLETKQTIENAEVIDPVNHNHIHTDVLGHYILSVPADTQQVQISKQGYKSINAQKFYINSSGTTSGNACLIPNQYVVGIDTVNVIASQLTQFQNVTGLHGKNKKQWDISANPQAPEINVQLNNCTEQDSIDIWAAINDCEIRTHKNWAKPGPVELGVTKGIIITKGTSNNTQTYAFGGNYIFNGTIEIITTDALGVEHEFGHVLSFGEVSFDPCFMNSSNPILPTTRDYIYSNRTCYEWNLAKQLGQNEFGISDITDSTYTGIAGQPPQELTYNKFSTSVYPNPVRTHATMEIRSPRNESGKLAVYNVAGQKVKEQEVSLHQGINKIDYNSNTTSSGVYLYRFTTPTTSSTGRFTKIE